jgi:AraC-like DNA-binding protein
MPETATDETVRIWRPDGLDGVEVMHVSSTTREWRIFSESYILSLNLEGALDWTYRHQSLLYRPGETSLIQPGEAYVIGRVHAAHSCWAVNIDPAVISRAAAEMEISGRPAFKAAQAQDEALRTVLARFHRSLDRGGSLLERQTNLATGLRLALERYAEQPPPAASPVSARDAVRRVREYLHAHLSENVSLDDLSRVAFVSKFHLARVFRETTGMAPHQYLTQIRVARARALIAAGVPISQAALDVGFAAQSHLHRYFVRTYSLTPGAYARSASH